MERQHFEGEHCLGVYCLFTSSFVSSLFHQVSVHTFTVYVKEKRTSKSTKQTEKTVNIRKERNEGKVHYLLGF